jgi:gas vesicle protein
MAEFLAGLIVGGSLGVFVVALCAAAARGEQDDG